MKHSQKVNGPQITTISIGSGGENNVPTTIDIGNGLTIGTLNMGTGMTTGVVNIGTSVNGGKSIINIGGVGDEVNVMGSLTYINTTNLDVSDNLITLNKGAGSATIKGAGIVLSQLSNAVETTPGWIRTDGTNARSWEIVPPNHPVSGFEEGGNGLAVCNVAKSATSDTLPVVGLRTTKVSLSGTQNLILKPDGNVGIGYADAALASVPNFPSSLLHIESTAGNQITLGSGNESSNGVNYVRTFLSSPISGNSNVILAVGRTSVDRATNISNISSGFRLAYMDTGSGSSSTLTLACTQNDTTFSTPSLTFFRNDGTALFSSNVCIENSKFFRMYSSTFSATANPSFEIDVSNGTMRIGGGGGGTTVSDTTPGSMTLVGHLILNDSNVAPTTANRPAVGKRGMLRFNSTHNSAEIFDGSKWADVGYYAGLPLGAIIAYPSNTVPGPSFMLCNGASLLNTGTYADLFALIQYTYGGSNPNFNLPNIKGRTIVGVDSTDTAFDSLGEIGGFKTHTLSEGEMPGHTHPVPIPEIGVTGSIQSTFQGAASTSSANGAHGHDYIMFVDSGDSNWLGGGIADPTMSTGMGAWTYTGLPKNNYTTAGIMGQRTVTGIDGDGNHVHSFTPTGTVQTSNLQGGKTTAIQATATGKGSSLPHNNLQPYIVLNYFIKVFKESSRYTSDPLVSDIRVKRNIEMLNSNQSIEMIRLLQPKRYEYIDRNMSVFAQHIGFIAQEAKLCIPESVCTKRDYIPNIYSMAKLTSSGPPGNALLTSVQHPISKIIREELLRNTDVILNATLPSCLKGIKLKMFNKSKECFYVCCVESIDDYNVLVEPLDATTTAALLSADYFVYGQEIEDYHYMNNDAVFSTLVSAFQALDKTCNELNKTCKRQELLITALIEKNNLKL